MDLNNIPIQEISTCTILVPLLLAAFKLKTGDIKLRLFFLFLLFGALVDGYGWFVYSTDRTPVPHSVLQYCYLFFEAIFFVWLCTEFLKYSKSKVLRSIFYILLFSTFLYKGWILYYNNWDSSLASETNSLLDGVFSFLPLPYCTWRKRNTTYFNSHGFGFYQVYSSTVSDHFL